MELSREWSHRLIAKDRLIIESFKILTVDSPLNHLCPLDVGKLPSQIGGTCSTFLLRAMKYIGDQKQYLVPYNIGTLVPELWWLLLFHLQVLPSLHQCVLGTLIY